MNLERHIGLLWRYRVIAGGGLLLAVVLAALATYQLSWSGGPKITPRGEETWSSVSTILVTQKGFPWGRVTLAGTEAPGQPAQPQPPKPKQATGDIPFADPARFSSLAVLYSVISHSDQVRIGLPGKPKAEQIQAVALDPTNSGNSFQPIISLTTTEDTGAKALALNQNAYKGLRDLLVNEQEANDIPPRDRVELTLLNASSPPILSAGRSYTSSILAFLLCVLGALALIHLLEGVRLAKLRRSESQEPATLESEETDLAPVDVEENGHDYRNGWLIEDLEPVGADRRNGAGDTSSTSHREPRRRYRW